MNHSHNDLREADDALREFIDDVNHAFDNGTPPGAMADEVLGRRTERLFRIAADVEPACGCALSVEVKLAGEAGQHINKVLRGTQRLAPAHRADLIVARAYLHKQISSMTHMLEDDDTVAAS